MSHERTCELHKLRTLHLFAGAGVGILADLLLGHHPVCAVEIEPYCQQVLHARQKDGILPWFPIFDDVKTFDGKPWRGLVDVVAGGFPCQDISSAGKGAGITGERSVLWSEMVRIIGEIRPRFAFVENSPILTSRGLGTVLGGLAEMGYDARWGVLGACDLGLPHSRNRIWIHASDAKRNQQSWKKSCIWKAGRMGRERKYLERNGDWEIALSSFRGMDDGLARSVDRTDAIRNGQIPSVAALAWRILSGH